tara:strand:+ start:170 stop:1108 length:939 start_codon:yes stop_codon:yes gene_type:complete
VNSRFCPKCGSKQEGNNFCTNCGNKLSDENQKVNLTSSENISTKENNLNSEIKDKEKSIKNKKNNTKKNKFIFIIIFLSLIVYGCLYFYDDGYYLGKKTYMDYFEDVIFDAGVRDFNQLQCSPTYSETSINNNIQGIFKIDIDELSKGIELVPKRRDDLKLNPKEYNYIQIAYLLRIRYLTEINEFELALDDYDALIKFVGPREFDFSCFTIYLMDRILLENKYSEENNLKIDDERLCNDFVNSFRYKKEFRDEDGDIIRFILDGESDLQWEVWSRKYVSNTLFLKIMENCNLTIKKMDNGALIMREKYDWE